jgi:hypothetical protein
MKSRQTKSFHAKLVADLHQRCYAILAREALVFHPCGAQNKQDRSLVKESFANKNRFGDFDL